MKQKLPLIAIAVILLAGIGIFLYPTASDILSRITSTTVIKDYQKVVNQTDEKEMEAMIAAAEEYNQNLPPTLSMDPFGTSSEEPYLEDENYNSLLSVDSVMGYIDIPKIDVYLPVYHGTSEPVLQKGAGHLYGSALPVGGNGTHSVISAHRGLPSAKLFTDLDQIREGDVFYYHILNRILAYQVDQIIVVEPTELEALNPQTGQDYMTLFTCTPYGINSHRMLIRGHRIPYEVTGVDEPQTIIVQPPKTNNSLPGWVIASLAGAAGVLFLAIGGVVYRWKRRRKKSGALKSEKGSEPEQLGNHEKRE